MNPHETTPGPAAARGDEAIASLDPGAPRAAAPHAADAGARSDGRVPGAVQSRGALEETIRIVRARKWILLITILVVGGAALALSVVGEEEYEAKATILFRESATAPFLGPEVGSQGDPQREAATRQELLELDVVARRTAKAVGAGLTTGDVSDKVRIDAPEEGDV